MKARRDNGLLNTSVTNQAIINITMAAFSECSITMSSETAEAVESAIERFLRDQITFDDLTKTVLSLVGVVQPLDRLRAVLDTGADPIPCPESEVHMQGTRRRSRAWTPYEDQRLLAGILRCGIENWTAISKFVGNGRTRSQCSQRWYRGLDPKISKDQWTKEEEQRLLYLVMQHGDKSWTNIAVKLGNRSDVQCRYRYRQLQKERGLAADAADDESPAEEETGQPQPSQPAPQPPQFVPYPGPIQLMNYFPPGMATVYQGPMIGYAQFPQPILCRPIMAPPPTPPRVRYTDPPEVPMQFQIPPVRQVIQSPMPSPGPMQSPAAMPFSLQPVPVPVQIVQSPIFYAASMPAQPDPPEHHEGPAIVGQRHAISAPAFDGRMYSVY
jgi:hypothetical protein